MQIETLDELDTLNPDQLWAAASNAANDPEIRHEAIQRWLFPEASVPGSEDDTRLTELRRRARRLAPDEVEEDDIEDIRHPGSPYFDGAGRLMIEHDGVQYLIDEED
jgi:hypothetical protein